MGRGKTLEWREAWTDRMKTEHGNGSGHGPSLAIELLRWEDYEPALARWGDTIGRPHPDALTPERETSPAFVEWMMGLPAGWVTDTPGITRNEALKALGNGVVPQQAEAALRFLLPALARAA